MALKHPSTPSSSSDDDPSSDLSPYSTLRSSPIHINILEPQKSVYDYLHSEVEDPFQNVPLFDCREPIQPCLPGVPEVPSHQTRGQDVHMLTPMATPSAITSVGQTKATPRRTSRPPKKGAYELPAPLSELTKHMAHIPLRDMEAHANRPLEVRLKEVEKKNGKIARPMNSFLLYRSAYAERTKEWCSKNNHQVVSRVSGASWPQETNEIREKYERLAIIERENHRKAHPDYKFTPNKNSIALKRKRSTEFDDGDFEGLEDEFGYNHFAGDPRFSIHPRMRNVPYGMPASYHPSLDHNNPYGGFAPIETWAPIPPGPAVDEYQRAMLRSQMEGNMMRADAFPLGQWAGQDFNFTPALTPSGHRRTLEAPVHNANHQPPSFTNAVDPQLLEVKDEPSFNNSAGFPRPMDNMFMPYSDVHRGPIPQATCHLPDQMHSSVNHTYRTNDAPKFEYDGMNFGPGSFPMT